MHRDERALQELSRYKNASASERQYMDVRRISSLWHEEEFLRTDVKIVNEILRKSGPVETDSMIQLYDGMSEYIDVYLPSLVRNVEFKSPDGKRALFDYVNSDLIDKCNHHQSQLREELRHARDMFHQYRNETGGVSIDNVQDKLFLIERRINYVDSKLKYDVPKGLYIGLRENRAVLLEEIRERNMRLRTELGELEASLRLQPIYHTEEVKPAESSDVYEYIREGDVESFVEVLQAAPTVVNFRSNFDDTPLHVAARMSNLDLMKQLLDSGADPNAAKRSPYEEFRQEMYPLHYCVQNNFYEGARLLLERGADPNVYCSEPRKYEKTPLHMACENNNFEMVELLLRNGANPNLLRTTWALVSSAGYAGVGYGWERELRLPLHIACMNNSFSIVTALVKFGSALSVDSIPVTPLSCTSSEDIRRFLILRNAE